MKIGLNWVEFKLKSGEMSVSSPKNLEDSFCHLLSALLDN